MNKLELTKEQKTLRTELEQSVISTNVCLRPTVKNMNPIALLRNVHPLVRVDFAYKLKDEGMISKDELAEFIKQPTESVLGRFGR